jgi:rod shape-determining protein MreC
MTIDQKYNTLNNLRATLSNLLSPVYIIIDAPVKFGWWAKNYFVNNNILREENVRLRQSLYLQEVMLLKLKHIESENFRLRSLLQTPIKKLEKMLIGEIIAVDVDPHQRKILVNRGSHHGIYIGHAVIDSRGIIGQVVNTSLYSSTILMISDPTHYIPVQVMRNGLRTIATGAGIGQPLNVLFVVNSSDIEVGDLLVSSGLDQRYPSGYPVASVVSVIRNPTDTFSTIKAEPLADLEKIREVLFIWPNNEFSN